MSPGKRSSPDESEFKGESGDSNPGSNSPSPSEGPLPVSRFFVLAAFPLILLALGRFIPGPAAWGWNHFAYLSLPAFVAWIGLALALLSPWGQRLGSRLTTGLGARLFETKLGPFGLTLICGALFLFFSEAVFFLGDGYLIGELVAKGMPFRGFDNMDYRIHFLVFSGLRDPSAPEAVSSFQIYRLGSVLAGMIGTYLVVAMTARLSWERWQKVLFVVWFLSTGSIALFFGYVESYSFLYASLAVFSVASILVLERRLPLWVASLAFGFGLFFHLTAVFSGFGLLFLAFFAPIEVKRKRWAQAVIPTAGLLGISILAHALGGFDEEWVKREFFSSNAKSLLLPLRGEDGWLTLYHWKDLVNLVLLLFPVPIAVVLLRLPGLQRALPDRRVQFLLLQTVVIGILSLVLDRKLGGARDWDLLAAHSVPVLILGVYLLGGASSKKASLGKKTLASREEGASRRVAIWVMTTAWLATVPWVWLQHDATASVSRFESVAGDFPRFARAYAYEELGKYFRKLDQSDRAKEMYERCVETYPKNPRFHVLLGSIYMMDYSELPEGSPEKVAALGKAVTEYREGVTGGSDHHMALSHLGKALYLQGNLPEAAVYLEKAVETDPRDPETWVQLGMVRLQLDEMEAGAEALQSALDRDPRLAVRQALGGALLSLGRNDAAERTLRAAIASGERNTSTEYGLAVALTVQADYALQDGKSVDSEDLREAEYIVRTILERDPTHDPARRLAVQLRDVQSRFASQPK